MKKMKKLVTLILAAVMVLAMGIPVFADTPGQTVTGGNITVNNLDADTTQTLTAYPIFVVDQTAKSGYTVVNDSFKTVTDTWSGTTPENELTAEELTKLVDAAATATTSYTATGSNGTATFTGLPAGVYLIITNEVTSAGSNAKWVYTPVVKANYTYNTDGSINTDAVTADAKKTTNSLQKETRDTDRIVQSGDIIQYRVVATVPFNKSEFSVTDNIKGAEYYFTGDGALFTVTDTNGNSLGTFTPVTTGTAASGYEHTFTVDLSSLLTNNAHAGQVIWINYTAKAGTVTSIENIASSTNSDDEPKVTILTGSATITKYASDNTTKLAGAKFALYDEINQKYATFTTTDSGDIYVTSDWTTDRPTAGSTTQLLTTGADGTATVKGLNIGEYTFIEVAAPHGYSINDGSTTTSDTVLISTNNVATTQNASLTDTKLNELPSTGGRGTLIFTLIGCAVMVIVAASYYKNKNKAK